MTPRQQIAARLAFVLIAISGGLLGIVLTSPQTQARCTICTGAFYAASSRAVTAISGTIWPQRTSNACGISDAIALVNYEYLQIGHPLRFPNSSSQITVERGNQTTGASQWGYARPTNAWGGITNIAPDFGTDPRSVAYDVRHYTWSALAFHDAIYRWQFAHATQPSFKTQALEATTLMARSMATYHTPIIAFINGGLHSVVITGIWSSNNPLTHFPAGLQGLVFRDPLGNSTTSRQEINVSSWIGGNYASPWGIYSLWSRYYGDRYTVGDMRNAYDPEPTVGLYKPSSAYPHHWYLGFTWVARDGNTGDSVDLAINAYTKKVIRPSLPAPTPTATATATATPIPTAAPTATATPEPTTDPSPTPTDTPSTPSP
ncbi:MAG TPA: hypothetical protein VFS83_20470 [Ktedonobacterales bacterium]|nr:hypothetical protein [Ktedonobacterales bacterium]